MTEPNVMPLCLYCKHYRGFEAVGDKELPVCAAFPSGIPNGIMEGGDHRKPWIGDNGIRFKLAEYATQGDVELWGRLAVVLEQ